MTDFETREHTIYLSMHLEHALSRAQKLHVKAPGRIGPDIVSKLRWLRDEVELHRIADEGEA